jgi:hypothetical protein
MSKYLDLYKFDTEPDHNIMYVIYDLRYSKSSRFCSRVRARSPWEWAFLVHIQIPWSHVVETTSLMVMHGTKCQHCSAFVLGFGVVKLLITLNSSDWLRVHSMPMAISVVH